MKTGRRFFLSGVAAMLAGTRPLPVFGQIQRRDGPHQFPQNPQTPGIGSAAAEEYPSPPRPDPKTILKEDQKTLRKDVDRLLQLAKEFKEETDKTPETDVLSLSLVKKAEGIEKLAHQIKDRIRES